MCVFFLHHSMDHGPLNNMAVINQYVVLIITCMCTPPRTCTEGNLKKLGHSADAFVMKITISPFPLNKKAGHYCCFPINGQGTVRGVGWVIESQIHYRINRNHCKHGYHQKILDFDLGGKSSRGIHEKKK